MLTDLRIEVKDGDFTDPNNRTVVLMHGKTELARTWFNVVQKGEYDG
jgi:alpha-beta hydrolase superfamily lysophospholipase